MDPATTALAIAALQTITPIVTAWISGWWSVRRERERLERERLERERLQREGCDHKTEKPNSSLAA